MDLCPLNGSLAQGMCPAYVSPWVWSTALQISRRTSDGQFVQDVFWPPKPFQTCHFSFCYHVPNRKCFLVRKEQDTFQNRYRSIFLILPLSHQAYRSCPNCIWANLSSLSFPEPAPSEQTHNGICLITWKPYSHEWPVSRHTYCDNIDIVHTGSWWKLSKTTHIPTAVLLAFDPPNKQNLEHSEQGFVLVLAVLPESLLLLGIPDFTLGCVHRTRECNLGKSLLGFGGANTSFRHGFLVFWIEAKLPNKPLLISTWDLCAANGTVSELIKTGDVVWVIYVQLEKVQVTSLSIHPRTPLTVYEMIRAPVSYEQNININRASHLYFLSRYFRPK